MYLLGGLSTSGNVLDYFLEVDTIRNGGFEVRSRRLGYPARYGAACAVDRRGRVTKIWLAGGRK